MKNTMNIEEIKEKLIDVIKEVVKLDTEAEVPADNLFESLAMDSLMAIELLVSVEQRFEIEIDDEDLNVDLLKSLDNLLNYIIKKKQNGSV